MLLKMNEISVLLLYYTGSLVLFLAFSILRLVQLFPCSQWLLVELMRKVATVTIRREDYWQSLFTRSMFDSMRSSILLELQKSVHVTGDSAPDSRIFTLDGRPRQLLDFSEGNRPLVINFCSWTCPVFRARVSQFLNIVREFSDVADFLTVYVEEAHPCDGWSFKNNVTIPTHQTLEQRCAAAQVMLDTVAFDCPVVVDNMDGTTNKAYAGMPIRLYILRGRNVEYAGGIGPTFYNLNEVKEWLQSYTQTLHKNMRHRA